MSGFVYEWVHRTTRKYYIGSHKGSTDDGYIGSGMAFKNAVKKYGISAFERIVHYVGDNFRAEEKRLLIERDAANDPMSYNLKNEALGAALLGEKNGMYGKKHTSATKKQMTEKLSSGNRWGDPKKKDLHAEKMTGSKNPMWGISRTDTPAVEKAKIMKTMKKGGYEHLKTEKHHRAAFLTPLKILAGRGELTSPRGLLSIELENFRYDLPPYVRFCSFQERKLNLAYVKTEFLWYLRGDRFDLSILEHAKMWQSLVQPDSGINSNYGQYLFNRNCNQFARIIEILSKDKDSRRASMMILQPSHVLSDTTDQPCTYAIRFSIRNNRLGMTVHMRSQDAIFGMGNDAACFSLIHEMAYCKLREVYPDLEYGTYTHLADSFHVYERHFEMLKQITNIDPRSEKTVGVNANRRPVQHGSGGHYTMVLCPRISGGAEVDFLIAGDYTTIPEDYAFTKWLVEKAA